MARPGLHELISFDHLVTPRLARVLFWLGQLANASIWGLILRSTYKEYDYDEAAMWGGSTMSEGEMSPDFGMPEETIAWDNVWLCIVLFVLGIFVVRLLVDLALVQFRRLDAERAMLGALTGTSPRPAGASPAVPPATAPTPSGEQPPAQA
jgi:hypothetical protein